MEQEIFYKVVGNDEYGNYGSNAVGIYALKVLEQVEN